MSELYVPETPERLLELAQGITNPDAHTPTLPPYSSGLQQYLMTTTLLTHNGYVRAVAAPTRSTPHIPSFLQTEAYSRQVLAGSSHLQGAELDRAIGVQQSFSKLLHQKIRDGSNTLYSFFSEEALFPPEDPNAPAAIEEQVLKQSISYILGRLDASRTLKVRLLPGSVLGHTAGMHLVYPEGLSSPTSPSIGFIEKDEMCPVPHSEIKTLEWEYRNLADQAYSVGESRQIIEYAFMSLA